MGVKLNNRAIGLPKLAAKLRFSSILSINIKSGQLRPGGQPATRTPDTSYRLFVIAGPVGCRASVMRLRAQRREVLPNIWASLRSDQWSARLDAGAVRGCRRRVDLVLTDLGSARVLGRHAPVRGHLACGPVRLARLIPVWFAGQVRLPRMAHSGAFAVVSGDETAGPVSVHGRVERNGHRHEPQRGGLVVRWAHWPGPPIPREPGRWLRWPG